MELVALIALVLLGLSSVLFHRARFYGTSRRASPPPPAPAAVVHKISDPGVAHRALVENAGAFSNRPVLPFFVNLAKRHGGQRSENISTVAYGPHWRALRRNLTAETLHPSRLGLAHLAPLQREPIRDLVAALSAAGARAGAGAGAVVVRDHLRTGLSRVIARLCFGDGADESQLRAMCSQVHALQVAIGEIDPLPGSTVLAKLAKWRHQRQLLALHARITEVCVSLIAVAAARQRRRPPAGDGGRRRPYVDSLIELRVPDADGSSGGGRRALRDEEMVDLLGEFLGSGTGSLVACLEWTLAHLVDQPEVQERLRREVDGDSPDRSQQLLLRGMPYMHAVVLESLRMHPPAPFAMRHVQAADAAAVLAVPGPGGTRTADDSGDLIVLFLVGDMGRDSKAWKHPDQFRPERFLAGGEAEGVGPLPGRKETRMMPFGAGNRFCPGVGLTMLTIKSFLAALVREFEWSPTTTAVDLTELDGFLKTMKTPLSARLTRRTHPLT